MLALFLVGSSLASWSFQVLRASLIPCCPSSSVLVLASLSEFRCRSLELWEVLDWSPQAPLPQGLLLSFSLYVACQVFGQVASRSPAQPATGIRLRSPFRSASCFIVRFSPSCDGSPFHVSVLPVDAPVPSVISTDFSNSQARWGDLFSRLSAPLSSKQL